MPFLGNARHLDLSTEKHRGAQPQLRIMRSCRTRLENRRQNTTTAKRQLASRFGVVCPRRSRRLCLIPTGDLRPNDRRSSFADWRGVPGLGLTTLFWAATNLQMPIAHLIA